MNTKQGKLDNRKRQHWTISVGAVVGAMMAIPQLVPARGIVLK